LNCVVSKSSWAPPAGGARTGGAAALTLAALLTVCVLSAVGANIDALDVQLYKGTLCGQGTNGAPSPAPGSPFLFQAILGPSAASRVSAVSVKTPALITDSMTLDASMNFVFTNGFASQSTLDSAYGNGTYIFKCNSLASPTAFL